MAALVFLTLNDWHGLLVKENEFNSANFGKLSSKIDLRWPNRIVSTETRIPVW